LTVLECCREKKKKHFRPGLKTTDTHQIDIIRSSRFQKLSNSCATNRTLYYRYNSEVTYPYKTHHFEETETVRP